MALNPNDILSNGHYRIIRQLGRGGFGFVYLAQDTLLAEEVAIKELIPALVGDEAMLKRFLAEAKATMRLRHKRIVGTHNVFSEGGNYYIVMEYMPGGSLEERLREHGPLPMSEAVRIAAEVCEGLDCAHEEGVVHCDLKPHNILFDAAGQAKVADFGIAHVSGEMLSRSWMTPAGFVAGTLPYMSPEQADGVRNDPRVDVYALGAVLYRMLTGRTYLEFDQRETPGAAADNVYRIRREPPQPPSTHVHRLPTWLDAAVLKALAKQPKERYSNVEALRAVLLRQQMPAAALPPTRQVPERRTPTSTPTSRRTSPGPGVGSVPAARKKAPLPSWFWPAVGGAVVLLVVLVIGIDAALRGGEGAETAAPGPVAAVTTVPALAPTHISLPTATPKGTDTPRPTATATTTRRPTDTLLAPTHTPTSRPPTAGATQTRSKDGMVMVYVPAGEFTMGSNEYDDEKPIHAVSLDAFWIDRTEVTNAQFRNCVEAGECQAPTTCDWGDPTYNDTDKADHPVVCVSWSQAKAYCEWAGARLPTEAEWEKAARGTDGWIYPWGNDFDCYKGNFDDETEVDNYVVPGGPNCDGYVRTAPVGSFPSGASPYGALDMAGNVSEWVTDWYDGDYYANSPAINPKGPNSGDYRVLRGGGWDLDPSLVRAADRYGVFPSARYDYLGFRCSAAAASPGE